MYTNKKIAFPVILASIMGTSVPAFAQATAGTSATGSVTIIRPLTIANTVGLQFGRIVKPSTGSAAISIANTADTVSTGSAVSLGGTISRAKFTIDGESAQAIDITVPGTFDMTGPGPSTLTVTLSPDQPATNALLSGAAIGSAGTLALNVGGSFSLPSTQATGVYSGTFTVNVSYQ